MSSHEFDAYCDSVALDDPPYHEQIAIMHELESTRETALKQQGAIDALQSLTITLSALCLREDVDGDYFFGIHDALQVVKSRLGIMKGGVL